MKCPHCGSDNNGVLDSRETEDGAATRRRRRCGGCDRRFTTYERVEERVLLVVKKDGRREPFSRAKVSRGLVRACEKRPVSAAVLDDATARIERIALDQGTREVTSASIGEAVMEVLRSLDPVAYVRFASVYRAFHDVAQFQEVLARFAAEGIPGPEAGQA